MSQSKLAKAILLGADPEVFVMRGGNVSHCIDLLGGSKDAPRKVANGAVQEDNVLFEFNIDPVDNFKAFSDNIDIVMAQGQEILGSEFEFAKIASHIFTPKELAAMPESAFVFGCDPDYNALTGAQNPRPAAADAGLRSAGGHVHFGWSHLFDDKKEGAKNVAEKHRTIALLADYYLGLPATLIDTDDRRRELYGKAGAYRQKSYGVEYRTLSNFWIFDKMNRKMVFDQAQKVYAEQERLRELFAIVKPTDVQNAINTGNRKLVEAYLKQLNVI